jgi:hypothetical protein
VALLLACLLAAAGAVAGCGGSTSKQSTPAALKLQREDLVAASKALAQAQASVASEVAATKAVWPRVSAAPAEASSVVARSSSAEHGVERLTQLAIPVLFGEVQARSLTGPASQIAGLFRSSVLLSTRGWKLLIASSNEEQPGSSPATARFARENAALYVESIYDGHFTLAQIGKKLLAGYEKLGGAAAFGTALTQTEVDALAQAYSEADERLHPHPLVRVGS